MLVPTRMENEFKSFNKIARLNRNMIVTEKIDGTNAQIFITDDGQFLTGSRNKWITPEDDNFGFSRWAHENKAELLKLGPGRHFGEWWGLGIQRGYGLQEKRFSLFNVMRWHAPGGKPTVFPTDNPKVTKETVEAPACCGVVPILHFGKFSQLEIDWQIRNLATGGSVIAPGFANPEGVVILHLASNALFKVTIEGDEAPKSKAK